MTQKSWPWDTNPPSGGPGDGSAGLNEAGSREFLSTYFRVQDPESEGVSKGVMNELEVTGSASPISIASGSGVCYGLFINDAVVNIAVATPAVGLTGGRVVLQTNWSGTGGASLEARTRIAVLVNTDGVAAIPALTQSFGTTWEISLATFTITTGGVITITDDRTFRKSTMVVAPGGLLDNVVTTNSIINGAVTNAKMGANSVNTTQLVNDSVTQAKIAAGAVSTTELADNSVTAAKLASNAVETAKILDANVTAAKLATDAKQVVKIAETVLSSATGTFTFSSIPTTYTHLKLVLQLRATGSFGGGINFNIRFNNDTGSNYSYMHTTFFDPSGVSTNQSTSNTLIAIGTIPDSNAPAGSASAMEILIPNYRRTTFHKSASLTGVAELNIPTQILGFGRWKNTTAINRIDVICGSGNFAIGSIVTLLGIL